jgi:hypothetical protein
MNRIKPLIFALMLVGIPLGGGAAPVYRTDTNPGLLYWEAIHFLPTHTGEDQMLFDSFLTEEVDDQYLQMAASYGNTMTLVRRAAKLKTPCDWGIDLADGADTLLPHLAKVKAVAIAVRFRAKAFLAQGKENEAVEDLVAAFVLARQAPKDGTLIAVLVQFAAENILITTVAENFHAFSPQALKAIQAGIDGAPAGTPVARCIDTGERLFVPWLKDLVQEMWGTNPGQDAKVKDELQAMAEFRARLKEKLGSGLENDSAEVGDSTEALIQSAGGTKAGLIALLKSLDDKYLEAEKILELPYDRYFPASETFFEEVRQSTNGLVRILFPALQKMRPREFYTLASLEALRAAIQFRLGGKSAFDQVRDPFGGGPFKFQRFTLDKEDRGFELSSQLAGDKPLHLVFVEKPGPWINVSGPALEKARAKSKEGRKAK